MKSFLQLPLCFFLLWLSLGFFVAVALGGDAIMLVPGAFCTAVAYATMPDARDDEEEESPNAK